MACAGDQLIYEVTLKDLRSEGAVVEAKAFLDGELLVDAEIVFAHLDNSRANQIFGPKNFVFTEQLLGVLDLAKAQQRAREADRRRPRTTDSPTNPPIPDRRERLSVGPASAWSRKISGKFADWVEFVPPGRLAGVIIVGRKVSRPLC